MNAKRSQDYSNKKFQAIYRGIQFNRRNATILREEHKLSAVDLSTEDKKLFDTLCRRLETCGTVSLWRRNRETNKLEYCASKTCDHRLCSICNGMRKNLVRRNFYRFFERNPEMLREYEYFHLVLTVPHSIKGFNSQHFYEKELKKKYTRLREQKWFKENVYAGFYSMEFPYGENGYHIHIHSLVLVYRFKQNRNFIYAKLLKAWNRITSLGDKSKLPEHIKEQLLKQFPEEVEDCSRTSKGKPIIWEKVVNSLSAKGSTFVWVESLYVTSDEKKQGYHWSKRLKKYMKYVKPELEKTFILGVMECIKYHFEPMALNDDGYLDHDNVVDLLPKIHFLRMYDKFGHFNGQCKNHHKDAHMLNIGYKSDECADEVIDFDTGEILDDRAYNYELHKSAAMKNKDGGVEEGDTSEIFPFPPGVNLRDALQVLIDLSIENEKEYLRDKKLAV